MKRALSISLLIAIFFNIGGYYLVFWGLKTNASHELIQQLDNDQYSEHEILELKIPLNLPYPLQQNGYERINGEFDYNNQHYKLVKQKLDRDTLFIVCVQDKKADKLNRAQSDFTKVANDLPTSSKQKATLISQLVKEYQTQLTTGLESDAEGWAIDLYSKAFSKKLVLHNFPITIPPPKGLC